MSSLFDDIAASARGVVEAVHGSVWRVFPFKEGFGPNGKSARDDSKPAFDVAGCFYVEDDGSPSSFRPDTSGRFGGAPSMHHGQMKTVSITKPEFDEIKTGFVLQDVACDLWYEVRDTKDDGAGNIICIIVATGKLF